MREHSCRHYATQTNSELEYSRVVKLTTERRRRQPRWTTWSEFLPESRFRFKTQQG